MIEHIECIRMQNRPSGCPEGGYGGFALWRYTVASSDEDEGASISGQRELPSCSAIRRFTLVLPLVPLPESTMTHSARTVQLIFPAGYSARVAERHMAVRAGAPSGSDGVPVTSNPKCSYSGTLLSLVDSR